MAEFSLLRREREEKKVGRENVLESEKGGEHVRSLVRLLYIHIWMDISSFA
jgi:hypothetical protein